jgi:hypothetical protein
VCDIAPMTPDTAAGLLKTGRGSLHILTAPLCTEFIRCSYPYHCLSQTLFQTLCVPDPVRDSAQSLYLSPNLALQLRQANVGLSWNRSWNRCRVSEPCVLESWNRPDCPRNRVLRNFPVLDLSLESRNFPVFDSALFGKAVACPRFAAVTLGLGTNNI